MENEIISNDERIVGKKVGKVSVSMYIDTKSGLPFFQVDATNSDVLQLSYVIEDALVDF